MSQDKIRIGYVVRAAHKLVAHILGKAHLHYNDEVLEGLTSQLEDAINAMPESEEEPHDFCMTPVEPPHVCISYPRGSKSILTCCLQTDDIPSLTGAAYCLEEKCFHWHVLRGTGMKDILHIETPEEYEELFGVGSCQGLVRDAFTKDLLQRVYSRAKENLFPKEVET